MAIRLFTAFSQSILLKSTATTLLLLTLLTLSWSMWPVRSSGATSPRISAEQQRSLIALAAQEFAHDQDPAAVARVFAGNWSPQELASLFALMEVEAPTTEVRQRLSQLRNALFLQPMQGLARERLPLLVSLFMQKSIVWSAALAQIVLLSALVVGVAPVAWWARLARSHHSKTQTHPHLQPPHVPLAKTARPEPADLTAQTAATEPQPAPTTQVPQTDAPASPALPASQEPQPPAPATQAQHAQPPAPPPQQGEPPATSPQPSPVALVPQAGLQPQALEQTEEPLNLEDLTEVNDILASAFADTDVVDPQLQAIAASLEELHLPALLSASQNTLVNLRHALSLAADTRTPADPPLTNPKLRAVRRPPSSDKASRWLVKTHASC